MIEMGREGGETESHAVVLSTHTRRGALGENGFVHAVGDVHDGAAKREVFISTMSVASLCGRVEWGKRGRGMPVILEVSRYEEVGAERGRQPHRCHAEVEKRKGEIQCTVSDYRRKIKREAGNRRGVAKRKVFPAVVTRCGT